MRWPRHREQIVVAISPSGRGRPAARLLHGATALLCLAAAGLALVLVNPPDCSQSDIDRYAAGIVAHKLMGLAVLAMALAWWGGAAAVCRSPAAWGCGSQPGWCISACGRVCRPFIGGVVPSLHSEG
jgi:hypothetical protein